MKKENMQKLIDTVKKTGDRHELAAGIFLVRGDDLIEDQKTWGDEDESKKKVLVSDEVYWWGESVLIADADELAECY